MDMIRSWVLLTSYHTFRIEVKARYLAEVKDKDALLACYRWARKQNLPVFLLGKGSNVLFTKDFPGLIIKNRIFFPPQIITSTSTHAIVKAPSGMEWDDFVQWSLDHSLYGLENLSLIPGFVGSAPVQNIGAYGAEVSEVIQGVWVLDLEKEKELCLLKTACDFGYRHSLFKRYPQRYVILGVIFRLNKKFVPNISYAPLQKFFAGKTSFSAQAVRDYVIALRRQKLPDPQELPNAGSFFKNPIISEAHFQRLKQQDPALPGFLLGEGKVKLPAAYLIESLGFKGFRRGDAGVHTRQSLVLVNYGKASGEDILRLAEEIRAAVKNRYQILLEFEVNIL